MTRIVIASCMNGLLSSKQKVWREALAHQPDWLVLCGDNIYMDYFPNLNQSKHWDLQRFAGEMYNRYAVQFSVASFRQLVEEIPAGQVIGVWDDHDFAWNNCYGSDPSHGMESKKKVAAALYHHYFDHLNIRPLENELPALSLPELTASPHAGREIYRGLNIDPFRVLLCDGRSWRRENSSRSTDGSPLGDEQEEWLFDELRNGSGPFMIVSGSTMTAGDDQSWDYFQDFYRNRFLPTAQGKLVVFLAGDVHENRLPPRIADRPVEVVSSAAVLGFPFNRRNFGVIDLEDDRAEIFLFKRGDVEYAGQLSLSNGAFVTSMSVLASEDVQEEVLISAERASEQRTEAMRKLPTL